MEKIKPIRLVIVDANPSTREGLRRFLETEADLKVLGEASDGAEAAKLARQLKPDILLTPSENAHTHRRPGTLTRTEHSGQETTPVRVVVLAAEIEKSQIVEALQLGASGVVLMDSAVQVLLKAIQTVMAGEYWVLRDPVSNLEQCLRSLMQSTHE